MNFSRRDFIGTSLFATGATLLNPNPAAAFSLFHQPYVSGNFRGTLPIMQGLATRTTSQFIILNDAKKKYDYAVFDTAGNKYACQLKLQEGRSYSNLKIDKILVTGLQPNVSYILKVIDLNSGNSVDERFFRSLDTSIKKPNIMIASCMKDAKAEEREFMWDHVAATKPDVVFLIGDTCYADNSNDGTDEGYWNRYCETRSLLSHFRQQTLIPTLAVWDDHDFAGNNADSTFAKKDMTKQLFKLFWDCESQENALIKGPGVAQMFSAFNQKFFLMDSRYYRSPREATKPVHWGQAQEDFLFQNLTTSKTASWLMNGSQFFGGYLKKDAFEYWQQENLKNVCKQLARIDAPVVFASGDVHFSEYMRIEPEVLGYPTYEITSSSIHSTTMPLLHLREKNPRRIDANSANQFTNVQTEVTDSGWNLSAVSYKKDLKQTLAQNMTIRR